VANQIRKRTDATTTSTNACFGVAILGKNQRQQTTRTTSTSSLPTTTSPKSGLDVTLLLLVDNRTLTTSGFGVTLGKVEGYEGPAEVDTSYCAY
jgi:hypothetical protein